MIVGGMGCPGCMCSNPGCNALTFVAGQAVQSSWHGTFAASAALPVIALPGGVQMVADSSWRVELCHVSRMSGFLSIAPTGAAPELSCGVCCGCCGGPCLYWQYATRTCLAAAGLPTPRNSRISRPEDVEPAGQHVGFPAVIKPVSGEAAQPS
jgi:hypothetical protein